MSTELKACRELDARVALAKGHEVAWLDRVAKRFPSGEPMTLRNDRRRLQIVHRNPFSGRRYRSFAPEYSRRIEAAMQVLDHLRPDWEIQIQNHRLDTAEPMEGWAVRIGCYVAYAETLPLAICAAALKALEGGEG